MSKKVKRLYTQLAPNHYEISFKLASDKKSFSGTVHLTGVRKGRPSQRLTLHQKGLKVSNAKIFHTNKKGEQQEIVIDRTVSHKSYDEVRFYSQQTLYPGEYTIDLDFSGVITKNMDGVYPCFFEEDGEQKELIATQFESHHAREAFPCIDEPEAKATFQLTLAHASSEVALSNTLPSNEKTTGNITTTTFNKTPIMSTYLLAFVVGELESKTAKSKSGIAIRTWATKNQIAHTTFALEEAVAYMDFYEKYYDIPFPLEKCDFVALPDFASGAMENWGLITFREQTLLVDPQTSLHTKQYVALVVAHELTHQWFGNLVTMQWWTDLWLNEGFASWMEYLAADDRHPDWNLWTQFTVDEQQTALKMDALEHTHPIEVEVRHPDEIRSIFDIISYQKGASVIHMLHNYLGAEGFRDGLRHYLKKHSYQNTVTVDLWQALETATQRPVKDFMHAWTTQNGFPLLTVSTASDHLNIEQNRFVTNPNSTARKDSTLWPVPLLADGLENIVVHKKITNVPHKDNKQPPIILNLNQTGFYRVNYSNHLQDLQIKALQNGELSGIDRMGLLSDGAEAARAGYQTVAEYLDLLEHYRNETMLPVWEIMAGSLGSIRSVLSLEDKDNSLRSVMKPFIRGIIKPQLEYLSLNEKINEDHFDTLLRPIIIGLAARADDKTVVNHILSNYKSKIDKKAPIDPNLRSVIYSTVARLGGKKEYNELYKLYKETLSSDEKLSLTAGITSFKQPEIHNLVLELVKSKEIKFQDVPYWIAYSLMNRHSRATTWEWMKENWFWMKENMGTDLSFSRFPLYVARNFADEKSVTDYQIFFEKHMEPILQRSYNQGLEIAKTNTAWRRRDAENALKWFTQKSV